MNDIEDVDYFYLLHLFSEVDDDNNPDGQMSGEDFFKMIGEKYE